MSPARPKTRLLPGRLGPAVRQLGVGWALVACPGWAVERCPALEEALPRPAARLQQVVLQQALGGQSAAVELEWAVRLALEATRPALAATPQGARLERAAQRRAPVEA